MLPLVDQLAVFKTVNPGSGFPGGLTASGAQTQEATGTAVHGPEASKIASFRCPSDRGLAHVFQRWPSNGVAMFGGRSNYPAVNGGAFTNQAAGQTLGAQGGMFGGNTNIATRSMRDGTSYILAVGERKFFEITGRRIGTSTLWAGLRNHRPAGPHLANSIALVVGNCTLPINTRPIDPGAVAENGAWWETAAPIPTWHGFTSDHSGGCHFVLGDGSVRFLSRNLNPTTYINLSRIADGAVIGEF